MCEFCWGIESVPAETVTFWFFLITGPLPGARTVFVKVAIGEAGFFATSRDKPKSKDRLVLTKKVVKLIIDVGLHRSENRCA